MIEERITELENCIETLERRVEQLEQERNGYNPTNQESGLDHRDGAVINAVQDMAGEPSPRQLVRLYKTETDIRQDKTAKERAKTLRQKEEYKEAVEA